jgi:ribonucleoside-diphosphate reductase alpha chain
MNLTGIRNTVFLDRYARKDEIGIPIEHTPEEMWRRVAHAIAQYCTSRGAQRLAVSDFTQTPGAGVAAHH